MPRTIERALGWTACAAAVALLALALWLGGAPAYARVAGDAPHAMGASVRLPAVAGRPAAGYVTLHGGKSDDLLSTVASPLATRIELHGTSMAGGVMQMTALPGVRVPAGGQVRLAPGGTHLMIHGLRAGLKPGATIPLVLRFQSGREVRVTAAAVAPGAEIADPHGAH